MRNRTFFWYPLVAIFCGLSLTAQELPQVPNITVSTLDEQTLSLPLDSACIIFFLDGSYENREGLLQELNKIAYAFRMRRLKVIGIYADLEPQVPDREGIAELKGELGKVQHHLYFPLCLDIERTAFNEFQVTEDRIPMLFICDDRGNIVYSEEVELNYDRAKVWTEYALGFLTEEERDRRLGEKVPFTSDFPEEAETKPFASTTEDDGGEQPDGPLPDIPVTEGSTEGPEGPVATTATHKPPEPKSARSDMPVAATVAMVETLGQTETIGYKPMHWRLTQTVEDTFFYTVVDSLVNLAPLCIWGWGMLYCLAKMGQYRGMGYGFFGCFGFFCYCLWSLACRIPFELCIISPELWACKDGAMRFNYFLEGESPLSSLRQFYTFSLWQVKLILLLLLQCALIKGIAGRRKNEEVVAA